jgi:hypothetical protein
MSARRFIAPLLLLVVLTAALRAATPAGPDSKSANPAELLSGAKKSPASPAAAVPPDGSAPAVVATVPANPAAPAANPATTPAAAATDSATTTAAAPTTPVVKPGIMTAVNAKGPPPVGQGPTAPIPLSPRFQQVRTKIGALFDTRNAPPRPPDPRTNPFRPVGAAPLAPLPVVEGAEPPPVVVNNDLTLLQQAVGTIRVKGTVQRGKVMQLVITSGPGKEGTYKEGDIINVALPTGDPVHLRVRLVSARSVTLTLNDAEMVLKF